MTVWLNLFDRRTALSGLMVSVCVAGCSADSRDETAASDQPGNSAGSDAGATGGSTAGNATGGATAGASSGSSAGGGGLEVDASFIWIANTDEGTVSKLDTRTMKELARYRTSPKGQGKPSRTSVGPDGSVAVANRGGVSGQPSVEAGVTKIFASVDRCIDKNANGKIETSTGKPDVLPWGEDECVAWHRPLDYWSNRPVAWAPVTAPDSKEAPKVWTAGASTCTSQSCTFDVLRLNGATGVVEDMIKVGPLMGPDFTGQSGGGFPAIPGFPTIPGLGGALENYGPYGGASDAGGNFWTFTATTTHLVRVDAVTLAVRSWAVPNANGYGITIDPKGRVFVCGSQGVSRFDPGTEKWQASSATNVTLGYNGCMVDGKTKIWVGGGVDGGDPGLHSFDIETLQWIDSHKVGPVKGVSIDIDGFVWGVSAGGAAGGGFGGLGATNTAFRVDPKTGAVDKYDGLNNPYSYSDMTGFGLKAAGVIPII